MVSHYSEQICEIFYAVGIRRVVDAIKRIEVRTAVRGQLGKMLRHGLIGKQHEIFNEQVGCLALFKMNCSRLAICVQLNFYFCRIKFYGAPFRTPLANLF